MIEGYIGGRLGNQLLEYAMIRMLRWLRGDKEIIRLNFQPVYRGGVNLEMDGRTPFDISRYYHTK
jgi:hypothetical protein